MRTHSGVLISSVPSRSSLSVHPSYGLRHGYFRIVASLVNQFSGTLTLTLHRMVWGWDSDEIAENQHKFFKFIPHQLFGVGALAHRGLPLYRGLVRGIISPHRTTMTQTKCCPILHFGSWWLHLPAPRTPSRLSWHGIACRRAGIPTLAPRTTTCSASAIFASMGDRLEVMAPGDSSSAISLS